MTALVLLFLVPSGESDAAATLAMRQAAIQILGPATAIVIREDTSNLQDSSASEQRDALHAVAVVRLAWISKSPARAQLRLQLAGATEWTTRDIGFDPRDPPPERGRALGYSIAAVVAAPMPRASGIQPVAASVPPSAPDGEPAGAAASPLAVTRAAPGLERSFFLDASGTISTAFGGDTLGRGGQARIGWSPRRRVRLTAGAGARIATIGVGHASTTHVDVALGAAADLFSWWRITIAARGDLFLVRQTVSHFSDDDVRPVERSRWLPGFRPQVELSIRPSPIAAIVFGGGGELTTGRTHIYVHGAEVAVVPATRLVGEIGLRVYF